MRRITNPLNLLTGVALVAVSGYFLLQAAQGGKGLWQRQASAGAQATRRSSANNDPSLSPGNVQVYGVLAGQDAGASGDDAVPPPTSGPPSVVDHVGHVPVDASQPNHFLHGRFAVNSYQFFEFEAPSQATRPELEGTFRCLGTGEKADGDPSVEVLLMDEEEFHRFVNQRFVNRGPVRTRLSFGPSSGGEIYWTLKASGGKPRKYYLVFREAGAGPSASVVEADFTASFD